ncbi:ParA family protein [Rhodobacteraceae bacterium 2376]|uniref:ParA family protein n=1 Tax=Rhabdonatronobacter sediminivivens TaxID=2743469 RepID=A0A7Z0I1S9_9RHOB|nr:ParA family protein [Rhabdonatronobacter sediminivivens]NYS26382.1 ParA family protein [Rhabdonatronobacter sediminivivens]
MKTIVIAAQKGGAGKTTLARNIAVAASQDGLRVLCFDLDPQGSLRAWWEGRQADTPAMLERDPSPEALRATLKAAHAKFDLCVIDTPPAAPEWLSEALGAADLALIPVRPSPDDLRAVGATIAAVNHARVPFAFALSQTPRAKITEEAARVLAQHGRVAPINIAQRVSYAETGATGQGVTETSDGKAAAEITAIWTYVKGILHG